MESEILVRHRERFLRPFRVVLPMVPALLLVAGLGGCGSSGPATVARVVPAQTNAARADAEAQMPSKSRAVRTATTRGRRACRGERPAEVIGRYLPKARARRADAALLRMAEDPPKRVASSPGYALLAGAIYANSLPVKRRAGAAPACAKELQKKKSKFNEGASR